MALDKRRDMTMRETHPRIALFISVLCLVVIFLADLRVPLGFAGGVPYVIAVLASAWTGRTRYIMAVSVIASGLTIVGYFASPEGATGGIVMANRVLALVVIWTAAWMTHRIVSSRQRLHESEAQMRQIADNVPAAITCIDRNRRMIFANRAYEAWCGVPIENIIGKRIEDVPATSVDSQVAEKIGQVLGGEMVSYERTRMFPDGQERAVRVNYVPRHDAAGRVNGYITLAVDVSEQRGFEQKLREQQRPQAMGEVTGGVAHEFNNLLQVLIGNLEVAETLAGDNPALMRNFDHMGRALDRSAELTAQLLSYGQRQTLAPEVLDVGTVVAAGENLWRVVLGGKMTVRLDVEEALPQIRVDRTGLDQALLNLVLNAKAAMSERGTLTVRASRAPAGAPTDDPTRDYIAVSVHDTGRGMSTDVAAHAFDPFFTAGEISQNAGLGLSMVQGFAEQSGGDATIDSALGEGTTVTLCLPAIVEATPSQADTA